GPGGRSTAAVEDGAATAATRNGATRDARSGRADLAGGPDGSRGRSPDVCLRPLSDLHDAHRARRGPPGPRGTRARREQGDAPGRSGAHRRPPGRRTGRTAEGTGRAPHHHLTRAGKEVLRVTEVDRAFLRSLAEWRSDGVPVSTLYLDVDGRKYPRRRDFRARGDVLVRTLMKRANELDRESKSSDCADARAMRRCLEALERGETREVAL